MLASSLPHFSATHRHRVFAVFAGIFPRHVDHDSGLHHSCYLRQLLNERCNHCLLPFLRMFEESIVDLDFDPQVLARRESTAKRGSKTVVRTGIGFIQSGA